jgi:hypothetical protein
MNTDIFDIVREKRKRREKFIQCAKKPFQVFRVLRVFCGQEKIDFICVYLRSSVDYLLFPVP